MKQKIHFIKMHGAGNDYIYVDADRYPISDPSTAAHLWSMRRFGVGSDGLVLLSVPPTASGADFEMRIFNSDGSEGLMCGNASRCIGKWVYESGMTQATTVRLLTRSGVKELHLCVGVDGVVSSVTVDMGEPSLQDAQLFAPSCGKLPDGVFVSMGNPHYVIFVDDLSLVDVAAEGAELERHPCFPQRCNIEFVEPLADGRFRMRVWERGSGITLACGTGACAAAVAAIAIGRAQRSAEVVMDGGVLNIHWREDDNHVLLAGPAEKVFEGDIEICE